MILPALALAIVLQSRPVMLHTKVYNGWRYTAYRLRGKVVIAKVRVRKGRR